MANPIAIATKGKGYSVLIKRARTISGRYGLTAAKMDRALGLFVNILQDYDCGASFPITASALARHGSVIEKYQARNIEFAIHGLFHIDYSQLPFEEQDNHLKRARQIFQKAKVRIAGFRCPYLRWNADTLAALRHQGFAYDGSQGLTWDVLDGHKTSAYERVLNFYGALPANDYPSLPSLEGTLVRIPYSLPDDEALVERLDLKIPAQMSALWLAILRRTYELGELFTLGLHPERITFCLEPLTTVLAKARSLTPPVWIARLDEIAAWWRARAEARVKITDATGDKLYLMTVVGPSEVMVLARAVEVDAPTAPWADGYRQVEAKAFTIHAPLRPFIGLSPTSSPRLAEFLRQQGYIVEVSEESHRYACYFDQAEFVTEQERPLLAQIEGTDCPLVRLGRWPNGAHSALAITGDVDALTLWDYGLRFFGR